jgi:RNA-directed DNA polymerase
VQDKVREITRRNRGASLEKVIYELNEKLRGWINYFRFTEWNSQATELDAWIRRKLRCYRLKQRKTWSV